MIKKDDFFKRIDEVYDKWQNRRLEEARERCEAAIQKKLFELKELAGQGCNFGSNSYKKERIQTEKVVINGNDILENIQSELKEAGYDMEIVELTPSEQAYGSDISLTIIIQ